MKKRVYDSANEKRDTIISSSRDVGLIPEIQLPVGASTAGKGPAGYAEAQKIYHNYILAHGKRFTPERAFVLKKIYEQKVPVDIQTLHQLVCKEEGQVSLTTIYNNLNMLIEARLVRRLDLVGGAMAFFEKTMGVEPHGYLVCRHCGKIKTLQIAKIQEMVGEQFPKSFLITDYNLQVNGLCKKCQTLLRKEAEAEQKAALKNRKAAQKAAALAHKSRKKKRKMASTKSK